MPPRDYYKATRSPRINGGAPPGERGGGGYVAPSQPKPFVDKRVTKSVSTSDVATGKFTGGTQRATPKLKPDKTFSSPGTTGGPVGLGSPPPVVPPKKIILPKKEKEIKHEIPKDFKKRRKVFQAVSFFFPEIKASLGAPKMRFSNNWEKRNAQQHLMFTAMNPILATLHELPGFAGFDTQERKQDLYNNALRNEVLNRAREIDARKGKIGLTPSEDAIEQASFDMVNEQSKRMETGQEFSLKLPNISAYREFPGKVPSLVVPIKSVLNEIALNVTNQLMNWRK